MPFVTTWMDFEGIMLSEISQTEKNKYLHVESKRKVKLIETERRKVVAMGLRGQGNR